MALYYGKTAAATRFATPKIIHISSSSSVIAKPPPFVELRESYFARKYSPNPLPYPVCCCYWGWEGVTSSHHAGTRDSTSLCCPMCLCVCVRDVFVCALRSVRARPSPVLIGWTKELTTGLRQPLTRKPLYLQLAVRRASTDLVLLVWVSSRADTNIVVLRARLLEFFRKKKKRAVRSLAHGVSFIFFAPKRYHLYRYLNNISII